MVHLMWDQVSAWRLARHYLTRQVQRQNMLAVVSAIGALHAQVMSAAELQLWARVTDLAADDVVRALWQDRTLVKTWSIRGTLHLLTAEDFPLSIGALSTLKHYLRGSWLKYHGVTQAELDAVIEGVRVTLNGVGMTREQLADAIAIHADSPKLRERLLSGWGMLLKPAAFHGYLCFGPNDGKNVTFVQPEQWLGKQTPVASEMALKESLRRFLTAYGPATMAEFARWVGLPPATAKKLFRELGDEIEEVDVEGWRAWMLVSASQQMQRMGAPATPVVRLLPNFDPYTIAVAPHSRYVLPDAHKGKVYRPQGWISPVVVVDGRIIGVWEYDKKRTVVAVNVNLFAPASAVIKQSVEAEARRLARFLLADDKAELRLIFA